VTNMSALTQAQDAINWADGEKPELDHYFFQKAQACATLAQAEYAYAQAHALERIAESMERALPILGRIADSSDTLASLRSWQEGLLRNAGPWQSAREAAAAHADEGRWATPRAARSAMSELESDQLAVPDALKYILWRYGQDHSGEDHQERLREATEWLEAQLAELMRAHLAAEAWQPLADAWYGDNEHMLVISQNGASVQEWLHSDENDVSEISLPDAFRLCRRVFSPGISPNG
jgi:hypothetical protein